MNNQYGYAVLIKFGRTKGLCSWEEEHYQLNDWMRKLYNSKNPRVKLDWTKTSFEVELTSEDLKAFEHAVYEDSTYDAPEDCFDDYEYGQFMDEDSEFIDNAKQAFSEGCAVFYSSTISLFGNPLH